MTDGHDDNFLEIVARARGTLRKSDLRVADILLERPSEVVDMTLATLARTAEVSEPTVIRFCNAVVCDGFRDMRVRLARSLDFARSTSHTAISGMDDMGTIITKVFDFNLPNLNWARTKLDPASIGQAVTALQNARRIEFFGFGASGIVVLDAQQTFPLFGVPCGAPIDGHQMFITAAMLGPGDVVVAISNTGQTREVNQAARTARKKGTGVIAIMGADGPLSGEADIRILVDRLENADLYTPSVSRLGHLVINDMLAVAVSLAKDETHQRRIAETKERLATTRSSGVC